MFGGVKKMHGSCNCSGNRHFLTKDEKVEMLKDYKENLEKEVSGITERIKEIERNN